ncbi:hypothetical protein [uncultured Mitsuokella sp.]|uniref:hypothetical protein n=1 Tax=uncultured Mitsuokella sp. TaxID=453120 RepID=UPI00260FF422|nr:hypothetical protein [uncultured Mitsuokella sp.]
MMKPNGFDTVPAIKGGGFPQLSPGGYICRIVEAKEQHSKSGRNMLVLGLDIAEGEYKDFYLKQFQRRHEENPDTKWPCLYYQLTDGDSVGRLKGLLMALEESNEGFSLASWDWDEKKLKKLLCCGVFREEEYLNHEGKMRTSVKCISILPKAELPNVKVPEKKTLEPQGNANEWGYVPNESIPF